MLLNGISMLSRNTPVRLRLALLLSCVLSSATGATLIEVDEVTKLAHARANGTVVVAAVLAQEGRLDDVVSRVKEYRGRVDYADAKTGYLTVVLPVENVTKFITASPLTVIEFDEMTIPDDQSADTESREEPVLASAVKKVRPDWPPRFSGQNLQFQHDIASDIDGLGFRKRHAGNDGRGVVIAHIETFPDFLLPELQTALDQQGQEIPKFLDIINIPGATPSLESEKRIQGRYWTTRLSEPTRSVGTKLNANSQTYIVPQEGEYQLAEFSLSDLRGAARRIVEQARGPSVDQQPKTITVLWSESMRSAWLDVDADLDFGDEMRVSLYRGERRFGVIGKDDPQTSVRESLGYALQKEGDYLSINIGAGSHASEVAGAAAARAGKQGRVNGVAPGAQFVTIQATSDWEMSRWARGLITAFSHPDVDVVLIMNGAMNEGTRARDGGGLLGVLLARLQKHYAKPAFAAASNHPGVQSVWDKSIPESIISVGAYESAESHYANHGLHWSHADNLHIAGAEGPSGDGRLKPDIVAPAVPMSLDVGFEKPTGQSAIYNLPTGYMICGGTSCATPVATGVAALLVGAAKRNGLPTDADPVHRALRESARLLPRYGVYQQGRGLIQVDAAWRFLQNTTGQQSDVIEVVAPVRKTMGALLASPFAGAGLFEYEGWLPDSQATRAITLTRRSGATGKVRYTLSWVGNDGAFSTQPNVVLPLNKPVVINVSIKVGKPGAYSANLLLQRAGLEGAVATVPMTVVVPNVFKPESGYVITDQFELEYPMRRNVFFSVPTGVDNFELRVESEREGLVSLVWRPDGRYGAVAGFMTGPDRIRSFDKPMAGVWQLSFCDLTLRNRDWTLLPDTVGKPVPITVTAVIRSAELNEDQGELLLRNRYAALDSGIHSAPLAALREQILTISPNELHEESLLVPLGATLVGYEMDVLDPDAEVQLAVENCSGRPCRAMTPIFGEISGTRDNGRERILFENPDSGVWKTYLYARSDRPVRVKLRLITVSPEYGHIAFGDIQTRRSPGESWKVEGQAWNRNRIPEGFEPAAVLHVPLPGLRATKGRFHEHDAYALFEVRPLTELEKLTSQ